MASDLAAAARCWAEQDADAVIEFLRDVHRQHGSDFGSWQPPASLLIAFTITMRIKLWERQASGLLVGTDLPASTSVVPLFVDAFLRDEDEGNALVFRWWNQVLSVLMQSYGWTARKSLGDDIAMSDVDDDRLVDALAMLLLQTPDV
jgi:hypothetical protein